MITFAWHVHHSEAVVEPLVETIKYRIGFIKRYKPPSEVETRLRLLKTVHGELPQAVVEAGQLYFDAYNYTNQDYRDAWCAYLKVLAENIAEIERLHQLECPNCPWDGYTIFPDKEDK